MAKATMQKYVENYTKKYLPNNDKMGCIDVIELFEMAKAQTDADSEPSNYKYYLAALAFQAGFMRGYGSAKYDAMKAKKAKKG